MNGIEIDRQQVDVAWGYWRMWGRIRVWDASQGDQGFKDGGGRDLGLLY